MLEYLDKHPELWGYVIIPTIGWLYSKIAPAIAKRWPGLMPILEWLMHALPAAQGAYAKLRAARKPAPLVSLPPPASSKEGVH
jgi:hypothetical protein